LLPTIDIASRGTLAKFFSCTAYNDAVLLCNTQELVAAEKILAVAMTVSKYLSPADSNIAKRVEQACEFCFTLLLCRHFLLLFDHANTMIRYRYS